MLLGFTGGGISFSDRRRYLTTKYRMKQTTSAVTIPVITSITKKSVSTCPAAIEALTGNSGKSYDIG
jgi:hypothetical protein